MFRSHRHTGFPGPKYRDKTEPCFEHHAGPGGMFRAGAAPDEPGFCELQTVASQHGISFDPKPGVTREQAARQNTMVYKVTKALRLR
jgi:hypothetical protein